MRAPLDRPLSIGSDPADDEDTCLRKILRRVAAFTIVPMAVVWGLLHGRRERPAPRDFVGHAVIGVGIEAFAATRCYGGSP